MLYLYIMPIAFIRTILVLTYFALLAPEVAAVLLSIINYLNNRLNNKYLKYYKAARL